MNHLSHSNSSSQKESLPSSAVVAKKKRLFRFSLSTFLLVFTTTSGVLGIWLSLIQPTRVQWNAIRPLIERGVFVETSPSDAPNWVKRFLPQGETENVVAIFFGDERQPGDLDCLRDLPHLKRLHAERCGLVDEDVEQISQFQTLEQLLLSENGKLTNACAKYLTQLENLQFVDLHSTGLDWRATNRSDEKSNYL